MTFRRRHSSGTGAIGGRFKAHERAESGTRLMGHRPTLTTEEQAYVDLLDHIEAKVDTTRARYLRVAWGRDPHLVDERGWTIDVDGDPIDPDRLQHGEDRWQHSYEKQVARVERVATRLGIDDPESTAAYVAAGTVANPFTHLAQMAGRRQDEPFTIDKPRHDPPYDLQVPGPDDDGPYLDLDALRAARDAARF